MRNRILFILFLVISPMTTTLAGTSLSTLIGSRNLNQSEDVLPVVGVYVQKEVENFILNPELNLLFAFDPLYGGSEYDVGIGGVYNLRFQKYGLHLGIGASFISSNYGDNDSKGSAVYGHGGISWVITNTFSLGLDIRKSTEINSKSNSSNVDNGYFQYAVNLELLWQ